MLIQESATALVAKTHYPTTKEKLQAAIRLLESAEELLYGRDDPLLAEIRKVTAEGDPLRP